jgi:uncharacterized membrane protein YccF (DUF307 family)
VKFILAGWWLAIGQLITAAIEDAVSWRGRSAADR